LLLYLRQLSLNLQQLPILMLRNKPAVANRTRDCRRFDVLLTREQFTRDSLFALLPAPVPCTVCAAGVNRPSGLLNRPKPPPSPSRQPPALERHG